MLTEELKERERRLGFALMPAPNPDQKMPDQPDYPSAVSCHQDQDNMIVKRLWPPGGVR